MEDIYNILDKLNTAEKQNAENERMYIEKQQEMYKAFFQANIPEILRLREENLTVEHTLGNIKEELSEASDANSAIRLFLSHTVILPALIIFMFIYFKYGFYEWIRDSFGEYRVTGASVGILLIYPFSFMSIALPICLIHLIFSLFNLKQYRIFKKYNITKKEYKKVLQATNENDNKIANLLPDWLTDFVKDEFHFYKKNRSSRYGELAVELLELYGYDIIHWKRHIENMRNKFKESKGKSAKKGAAVIDTVKLEMEYQPYKSEKEINEKSNE